MAHIYPSALQGAWGRSHSGGVCAALEKLEVALRKLEERLEGRDYLADELSLADIAHAGNFVRLRELEERGDTSLVEYPNVAAWMERLEARESYKAAI
jgi:glutathione S-transferase